VLPSELMARKPTVADFVFIANYYAYKDELMNEKLRGMVR